MEQYQFEVCANSVESCLAAQAGGANRVELCAGIPEGGTTPSYGDIVISREALTKTLLHVIIRPRGGDFLYSPIEQRIMLKDIDNARRLGADGVVFGCLTAKGDVDLSLMRQLIEVSQGMSVTFHRAFDVCRNPQEALEQPYSYFRCTGHGRTGHPFIKEIAAAGRRAHYPTGRLRSK